MYQGLMFINIYAWKSKKRILSLGATSVKITLYL